MLTNSVGGGWYRPICWVTVCGRLDKSYPLVLGYLERCWGGRPSGQEHEARLSVARDEPNGRSKMTARLSGRVGARRSGRNGTVYIGLLIRDRA